VGGGGWGGGGGGGGRCVGGGVGWGGSYLVPTIFWPSLSTPRLAEVAVEWSGGKAVVTTVMSIFFSSSVFFVVLRQAFPQILWLDYSPRVVAIQVDELWCVPCSTRCLLGMTAMFRLPSLVPTWGAIPWLSGGGGGGAVLRERLRGILDTSLPWVLRGRAVASSRSRIFGFWR